MGYDFLDDTQHNYTPYYQATKVVLCPSMISCTIVQERVFRTCFTIVLILHENFHVLLRGF